MKALSALTLSLFLISCGGTSKKVDYKAPLPETQTVSGKTLKLKGQGFRVACKFGVCRKIYKIGLYADKKYATAKDVFKSKAPKKLYMRYTYSLSRLKLVDGWKKAYKKSCNKNCDATKAQFKKFLEVNTGMNPGDIMELAFSQKGVDLTIHKDKPQTTHFDSTDLGHNLLSIYLGDKPLQDKLKTALLGGH